MPQSFKHYFTQRLADHKINKKRWIKTGKIIHGIKLLLPVVRQIQTGKFMHMVVYKIVVDI
ncbi:hypothetical protein SDC9_212226 [bioreactor metagenome]|uniref:Uncharacterized protein n=1 Tax=bioreactor metagenome TaxID=1076179 RepID=A0A645JY39_9ZZZZ